MIDINLNIPIDTTPTDGSTNLIDSNAVFDGLATKQETLVSTDNIKTINGNSVLGSGNLVVSSSSGIHALVNASGSVNSAQITTTNLSSGSQVANRMVLYPFIPSVTFVSSNLFINVFSGVALANAKILIYSNVNGNPNALLYESADLNCTTSGQKTATTSFTFTAGVTYWLAFWSNLNPNIYTISSANTLCFKTVVTSPNNSITGIVTYGSAPNPNTLTSLGLNTLPFIGITQS